VPLLLRVAAGDPASEKAAVDATGRSNEAVRQAATFFIEQILLAPDADSYRVLGASPAASNGELRHNMALLMRWLHPDAARDEHSTFATRIGMAWNNLKTPDRRAAYDSQRQAILRAASREKCDRAPRSANREPLSSSRRPSRRITPGELHRDGLSAVLAFLLGRPRH
jgi:hypothetical protein